MTGITDSGVTDTREIAAAPAAVFNAITSPDSFARWFGGDRVQVPSERLDFVAKEGRTWAATMVLPDGNTITWAGSFVAVDPDRRVVFTITDQPEDPNRAPVTFELSPSESGTTLHFEQEAPGFSTEQKEGLLAGWQSFIDVLQQIAEGA